MVEDLVSEPSVDVQRILTEIERMHLDRINGQTLVEQDVYLDGREFRDCTFRNCHIFVKLGHFRLLGHNHFESCVFDMSAVADNLIALYQNAIQK